MSSHIRFLHGIPGTGPVDIYLGSDPMSRNLTYGELTPHMLVQGGRTRLRVLPAGDQEGEVLRNGIIIPEQSIYTLVMADPEAYPEILPVEEPALDLPEGNGALRIGNFTVPQDTWEVWLRKENQEPEPLFSQVTSQEVTEYVVLPEGDYSLEFLDQKGHTVTGALGIEIQPGNFYTVYLLGRNMPEEEAFPVITVQAWDGNSFVPLCTK